MGQDQVDALGAGLGAESGQGLLLSVGIAQQERGVDALVLEVSLEARASLLAATPGDDHHLVARGKRRLARSTKQEDQQPNAEQPGQRGSSVHFSLVPRKQ